MQQKTVELIEAAKTELEAYHPMTLRQVFYRLVSLLILENTEERAEKDYVRLKRALKLARKEGIIPWDWVEDRTRRPWAVSMWRGLEDYKPDVISSYRRDVWETQPAYLEVWVEKDALASIFDEVLQEYRVTLSIGRGHDSWSSVYQTSKRLGNGQGITVLCFSDFDPSGEDMVRSLKERLGFFGCHPEMLKVALTPEDITRYGLATIPVKRKDPRAKGFIAKHGDRGAELDALPPVQLKQILETTVRQRLDLLALGQVQEREEAEREELRRLLRDGG